MTESMQPLRPYEKEDTLKQFLQYDRKVLRFFCLWNDTDSMFGDVREMVLHYFLADDTIEIREVIPANSGRDAAPMFLRRQMLPKEPVPLHQPGEVTSRTVLNVFGPMGHGGRWILDSLKTGAIHIEYYHDSDLTLGSVINAWGRKMMICDCDDFTKEYYKSKYGLRKCRIGTLVVFIVVSDDKLQVNCLALIGTTSIQYIFTFSHSNNGLLLLSSPAI